MRMLILIKKDGYESSEDVYSICPFCKSISNNHDIEDYVEDNCVVWCDKCDELMICTSPKKFETKMFRGKKLSKNDCTKKLSKDEARAFMEENELVFDYDLSKYHIYTVGLLRITELSDVHFEGMDDHGSDDDYLVPTGAGYAGSSDSEHYNGELWQGDVMRFCDAYATGCNLDHGGTYLYYKAQCTECGTDYKSWICGD